MQALVRRQISSSGHLMLTRALVLGTLLFAGVPLEMPLAAQRNVGTAKAAGKAEAPGVPFSADKLTALLPPSVYFSGRTAPLQLRNAGATKFTNGSILWVSLVDSSGYASSVQERYQFYVVTEGPLRFGDVSLRPGAYGGGFVGDRFVLMDIGDHSVGEGPTQVDAEMPRPRPLQIVADQPDAVKLYLGRKWVTLRSVAP